MTLVRIPGHAGPVDVIDADCPFRPCFRFGYDKGPFTPGIGYTRPETPWRRVCLTRHLHGCPHVGVHLTCGNCHKQISGAVANDEERDEHTYAACPHCGSPDLYWLADVLEDPAPCCAHPDIAKPRSAYTLRQRCRSCGTWLTGRRLELARAGGVAAAPDPS